MRRMKRSQRICAIGIALAAILGSIGSAPAEIYPSRPLTMIVPDPAGGLFDALARILAEPMRAALAKSVVIENVGGAGGSIAYYGTYTIDEATRVITVNVEASTFPNFTGGTQTRILSFDGDEVTYLNPTPSHGGAPAKVTYRRVR